MLRVHAARKAPTQEETDREFTRLLALNPEAKIAGVRARGRIEKRDGKSVFLPSLEHGQLPAGANPLAYEADGRYVLNHKKDMTNTLWLYLGGLAALVLAVATFRLWPVFLQVGVWYLSVTVLVVILGFFAIQLSVFVLLWGFGFDLWIFPKVRRRQWAGGERRGGRPLLGGQYGRDGRSGAASMGGWSATALCRGFASPTAAPPWSGRHRRPHSSA